MFGHVPMRLTIPMHERSEYARVARSEAERLMDAAVEARIDGDEDMAQRLLLDASHFFDRAAQAERSIAPATTLHLAC